MKTFTVAMAVAMTALLAMPAYTSAGGGVRFFFGPDLRADIGGAAPLSYRAPDNSSRSARLLFSLSNSFRLCPEKALARCL